MSDSNKLNTVFSFVSEQHPLQFVLSIVILLMYYNTYILSKPSELLGQLVAIVISYWFYTLTANGKVREQDNKIEAIKSKVDTQESIKVNSSKV